MTQIDLNKIGFFNPGRLSDKEIELSFIARQPLFEHLFNKIVDHVAEDIPQHLLIIGQRGMGKTSLLMRIAVELKKPAYSESFIPLAFPEEQYNIDRLSKFWLNSLDALADALDREGKTELVKELDRVIAETSSQAKIEQFDVFQLFEQWSKKIGRRPVLLVDNLNLIFDKISKDEQHSLRAILIQEGAPIVVGASATSIKQTVDYGEPFYDAFQTSYLKKLDLPESIEVLKNLGRITKGDNSLDAMFSKYHGRIAALHHLTGGTPRTLAMLFPLIRNGFSSDVHYDLEALLDIITPLYKARFEELSSQMQIILDAIALHWDPIDLEGIRNTTRLTNAQLSPQVKRLADVGWIKKLKSKKSKGGVYEISERFFNVWYLMRRSSRRQIRELYCLTKFLEVFYGPDLDEVAKKRLTASYSSPDQISLDLAFADATTNQEVGQKLRNRGYQQLLLLGKSDSTILKSFDVPKKHLEKELLQLNKSLFEEYDRKDWNNVIKTGNHIIALSPGYGQYNFIIGEAHKMLGEFEDAKNSYIQATKSDKIFDDQITLLNYIQLSSIYLEQYNDLELSKKYLSDAESFIPQDAFTLREMGFLQFRHNWYDSAKKNLSDALKLDPYDAIVCGILSAIFIDQKEPQKAIPIIEKALEQNHDNFALHFTLGLAYSLSKNTTKTKQNYDAVFRILSSNKSGSNDEYLLNTTDEYLLNTIGSFYLDFTKDNSKAQFFFKKAVLNHSSSSYAKYNLIFTYFNIPDKSKVAVELLKSIPENKRLMDTHSLCEAILSIQEQNIGDSKNHLASALNEVNDELPSNTQDDWWRTAATIVKLGYGEHLVSILKETGNDIVLRPYYEAIRAILEKDPESHFNQIAAEVREPTRKILEFMQRYNSN